MDLTLILHVKILLDITPRVIAMGIPSITMEAYFRNDLKEVRSFFDLKHKDHYKIYNLYFFYNSCIERKYPHESFNNQVEEFEMEDHYPPRNFMQLYYICSNIVKVLKEIVDG